MTTNNNQSATTVASSIQKEVADAGVSAWVAASAGSGKTKVLVDRVLNLLLHGGDARRIWCITYTNAGASEMVGRINKKLKDFTVMSDTDLVSELQNLGCDSQKENFSEFLHRARSLFAKVVDNNGSMKITTIHGLCQWILKCFPVESGLSPYFTVLEEDEAKKMLSSIADSVLRDMYENSNDRAFFSLIKDISNKKMIDLLDGLLGRKIKLIKAYDSVGGTFDAFIEPYYQKLGVVRGKSFLSVLKDGDCAGLFRRLRDELTSVTGKAAEKVINAVDNYLNAENDDDLLSAFDGVCDEVFTNDNVLKKTLMKYPFMESYAHSIDALRSQRDNIAYLLKNEALLKVALEVVSCYRNEKQKRMLLDFDDLIMTTENLLKNADDRQWVLYRLDSGLDHLLLDEAQDTSPEQWRIIEYLCEEFFSGESSRRGANRTLFVVGDKKQSIYSFQGARPEMFDRMRQYFAGRVAAADASGLKERSMSVSFRSSRGILDIINYFLQDKNASDGVVGNNENFKDIEHLTADCNVGKGAIVELWPLSEKKKNIVSNIVFSPERQSLSGQDAVKNTALKVAKQIKALLDGKADGIKKTFQPSDIMILLRTRTSTVLINSIVKYCKEMDIPIIGADKFQLKNDIIVADLLSLGKFLLSPYDDLSLAEVLRSPLIKSSLIGKNCQYENKDDYLYGLCTGRGDLRLFDVLKEKDPDVFFVLNDWLGRSLYDNPYDLYAMILDGDYGGRRRYIAAMGKAVDDILKEFLLHVLAYEKENYPTLYGFVDWLTKTEVNVKRENSEEAVKALNAVRIMTVHAAKGLQSEIVIIPDSCSKSSLKQDYILSDDEMFFIKERKEVLHPEVVKILHAMQNKNKEEYHRLLYVALSRAKTAVYITGTGKDYNDDDENSHKTDAEDNDWYSDMRRIMQNNHIPKAFNSAIGDDVFRLCDNAVTCSPSAPAPSVDNVVISDGTLFLSQNLIYSADDMPIPSYLDLTPYVELSPLKPLRPSRPDDEKGGFTVKDQIKYRRGSLIHKLLEIAPDVDEDKLADYLRREGDFLSDKERGLIMERVKVIMEEFSFLFGPNSRAEVPVVALSDEEKMSGKTEKREIAGQIDRLVVADDTVMIVDYKTNREIADDGLMSEYRRQLKMYADIMAKIYPDKKIKTYLLWTEQLQMDEIE